MVSGCIPGLPIQQVESAEALKSLAVSGCHPAVAPGEAGAVADRQAAREERLVHGGPAIEEFFTNRLDPRAHPFFATIANLKASAHFLVRRSGAVIQFVPCAKRAWHAGEDSLQYRAPRLAMRWLAREYASLLHCAAFEGWSRLRR